WRTSDGRPYALTGSTVNNGEGYVAKLKQRQVIDPKLVPSGSHLWWSQAGNDFGCPPTKGHNLDIDLRQLAGVPAGTPVTLAGKASVLRFTYATDPGLAKAGWFIDDIKITAGGKTIYSSDVEQPDDPAVFNGGCREGLQTAALCTKGWQYTSAVDGDPADHAYYMEMRDRSGFDYKGRGEDDRDDPSSDTDGIQWQPGLSLVYTDENHGYGNVGTADP